MVLMKIMKPLQIGLKSNILTKYVWIVISYYLFVINVEQQLIIREAQTIRALVIDLVCYGIGNI